MASATTTHAHDSIAKIVRVRPREGPRSVTLLELVQAVSASTDDDREVVATIVSMLTSGRVKLRGNFRNEPVEEFED